MFSRSCVYLEIFAIQNSLISEILEICAYYCLDLHCPSRCHYPFSMNVCGVFVRHMHTHPQTPTHPLQTHTDSRKLHFSFIRNQFVRNPECQNVKKSRWPKFFSCKNHSHTNTLTQRHHTHTHTHTHTHAHLHKETQ